MSNDRFLLIKAWSYILWADVDHVLGQLLIAELTDRIPVVYWPTHCLHNGFVHTNGFELFFEPVSGYTIFNIVKPEYTYYPPVWDYDNLLIDDQDKETLIYRNIGDMMCSKANVVVGDMHFSLYDLIPFITKNHPAYGMNTHQIYRYLFSKYIKIKPDIEMEVQGFYNSWLKDSKLTLAVHVRRVEPGWDFNGPDKYKKTYDNRYGRNKKNKKPYKPEKLRKKGKFPKPNEIYHSEIKKYIEKYNIKRIFLLTDCEDTLKEYQKIYGSMLVFTECKRISGDGLPSHLENPMVKRRRGIEVIKDTYLASRCEFFIGNDFSKLSNTVTHIRDWQENCYKLLYWKYKKRKVPVNVEINKSFFRSGNIFKRLIGSLKKLFDPDKKI